MLRLYPTLLTYPAPGRPPPSPQLPSDPLVSASFGPLGPECRGGCSLAAVLDVPRLRPEDFPPARAPGVPVSRLFDPLAPHTHTMTLDLTVRQDNRLEVAVQAAGGEGGALATVRDADGKEVPAVQPGQQAQVGRSHRIVEKLLTLGPHNRAGTRLLPIGKA